MSGWKAKRFWKEASVERDGEGWGIRLDARAVKTPSKAPLIVPTEAMARAIAAEWDAQTGEVKPDTMPFTRSANSAIDKVAVQFDAVAEMLAAYGGTDLLCYRADAPEGLIARQKALWDPLLEWSATELAAPLAVTSGVLPIAQDPASLEKFVAEVKSYDNFQLTALHDLIAISGSLVIGLAVARGRISVAEAWEASRVDETWQAQQWGADEEAEEIEALKRQALEHAAAFLAVC